MAIWQRTACWISKATRVHAHARARTSILTHTRTHTHRNMQDNPFPWQQLFRERASMLSYTYIACLVTFMTAC
jgi:hypothetical protein